MKVLFIVICLFFNYLCFSQIDSSKYFKCEGKLWQLTDVYGKPLKFFSISDNKLYFNDIKTGKLIEIENFSYIYHLITMDGFDCERMGLPNKNLYGSLLYIICGECPKCYKKRKYILINDLIIGETNPIKISSLKLYKIN